MAEVQVDNAIPYFSLRLPSRQDYLFETDSLAKPANRTLDIQLHSAYKDPQLHRPRLHEPGRFPHLNPLPQPPTCGLGPATPWARP